MFKNRSISFLLAAVFLITITSWIGCAGKTQVVRIKPAEVSIGKVNTLAILKFGGEYGDVVRDALYSKMASVKHFNLIDTTQANTIDKVVYDQIDDPRFLPGFEAMNADAVISAKVISSLRDNRGSEKVTVQEPTGQYKKEKNIFGKMTDVEIKRPVTKNVPLITRHASIKTHFKVFNLKTKQVLATDTVTETFKDTFGGKNENSFSGKSISSIPPKSQTLNDLAAKVAARLAAKISPTEVVSSINFDDGSTFGIGGHSQVKNGIKYAKNGAWGEAVEVWKAVLDAEPNNAPAFYNLGVAHERIGDMKNLNKAKGMYKKAQTIEPKNIYMNAITRINIAIKDRQKLDQQKKSLKRVPKKSKGAGGIRVY